jgi:hypothetical protein
MSTRPKRLGTAAVAGAARRFRTGYKLAAATMRQGSVGRPTPASCNTDSGVVGHQQQRCTTSCNVASQAAPLRTHVNCKLCEWQGSDSHVASEETSMYSVARGRDPIHVAVREPFHVAVREPFHVAVREPFHVAVRKRFHVAVREPFHAAVREPFHVAVREPFHVAANSESPTVVAEDVATEPAVMLAEEQREVGATQRARAGVLVRHPRGRS